VFGRSLKRKEPFKKNSSGDYDVENKRLCNVAHPVSSQDAVNFQTLHQLLQHRMNIFKKDLKDLREEIAENKGDIANLENLIVRYGVPGGNQEIAGESATQTNKT